MIYAVLSGDTDIVKLLLDNKADINAQGTKRTTSLHRAAQMGTAVDLQSAIRVKE